MKRILPIVVILMISMQTAVYSDQSDNNEHESQVSFLYKFIPGDSKFRVDNHPVTQTNAILVRKNDSLSLNLSSRDLPEGAYTVWMRVFNMPELCVSGEGVEKSQCSRGEDLSPAAIPTIPDASGWSTSSVFWIAGMLVGEDGIAHVSTSIENNQWPGMVLLGTDVLGTDREGVWNPMSAEIHIVLRYHGKAVAAKGPFLFRDPLTGIINDVTEEENDAFITLGRQLNRVLGNCSPVYSEAAGNCEDLQMAVFSMQKKNKYD